MPWYKCNEHEKKFISPIFTNNAKHHRVRLKESFRNLFPFNFLHYDFFTFSRLFSYFRRNYIWTIRIWKSKITLNISDMVFTVTKCGGILRKLIQGVSVSRKKYFEVLKNIVTTWSIPLLSMFWKWEILAVTFVNQLLAAFETIAILYCCLQELSVLSFGRS